MSSTALSQSSALSAAQLSGGASDLFSHSLYQPQRIGSLAQGLMPEQQSSSSVSGTPSTSSATPSSQTPLHGPHMGQAGGHTPLNLVVGSLPSAAGTGSAGSESSSSLAAAGQAPGGGQQNGGTSTAVDKEKIYQWINELTNPETREHALLELR